MVLNKKKQLTKNDKSIGLKIQQNHKLGKCIRTFTYTKTYLEVSWQQKITTVFEKWPTWQSHRVHECMRLSLKLQGDPKKFTTCFCQNFVKSLPNCMWGTLTVHITWFMSTHYRVKRRHSKLLHNAESLCP